MPLRCWAVLATATISTTGCGRVDYDLAGLAGTDGSDGRDASAPDDAGVGGRDGGPIEEDAAAPGDGGGPGGPCAPWPSGFRFEVVGALSVSGPDWDLEPSLGADGRTIYFESTREGQFASIFSATRPSVAEDFGAPALVPWASSADEDGPLWIRADGLEAFLASRRGGSTHFELWTAVRAGTSQPFGPLEPVSAVNTELHEWDAFVTADGLELWFGRGEVSSPRSTEIMRSTRTDRASAFGSPAPVAELNLADGSSSANATLDASRRTVVFMSDRDGGAGGRDVWYATRASSSEPFGEPAPLPGVNTPDWDWEPHLRSDGCELLFVRGDVLAETDILRAVYVAP